MYATLMAGFTTVQSVGAMLDGDLGYDCRDGIPGPRLFTSRDKSTRTQAIREVRERVDQLKAQGADLSSSSPRRASATAER